MKEAYRIYVCYIKNKQIIKDSVCVCVYMVSHAMMSTDNNDVDIAT